MNTLDPYNTSLLRSTNKAFSYNYIRKPSQDNTLVNNDELIIENNQFFDKYKVHEEKTCDFNISLNKKLQKDHIIKEIVSLQKECEADNWDGYGALKITKNQANVAKCFLDKLLKFNISDKAFESIDITPENEGNIAFDWFVNHDRQASISVIDNKFIFTYRFDDEKYHKEISIDDNLINLINKFYNS